MTEFYSIKDICRILKCNRQSVSEWCRPDKLTGKARLASFREGKLIRVPKEAFEQFIKERTRAAWF